VPVAPAGSSCCRARCLIEVKCEPPRKACHLLLAASSDGEPVAEEDSPNIFSNHVLTLLASL
jgi:hypothetical protein